MAEIAHKANEKVVWFMTWASKNKPELTDKLEKAYLDIARQTHGYVAPVGLAFARAVEQHPEINLYHSDMTERTARALQQTAWDSVVAFREQKSS